MYPLSDHPEIIQIERTGHPTGFRNLAAQSENNGFDYYGNEILTDDVIVIDREANEIILSEHLDNYLISEHEFKFYKATQPGLDHFKQKIEIGDMIAVDTKRGEIINKENTDDFEFYLTTHYGFKFTIAD